MRKLRLLAFFFDYLILLLLSTIVVFVANYEAFFYPTEENFRRPFDTFYPILITSMIVFYNKELISGRSIGKRIVGIGVRESTDPYKIPGTIRLFLRNLFLLIWPIELILFLITGKRLGDRLVKTSVIQINSDGTLELSPHLLLPKL